ncbi:MAG: DUF5117 domain-containing protein, partial [Thermoguttaceae bacterium]|nr:DUF5117 domain-containing protein [Thermoguttaceae bacterium]
MKRFLLLAAFMAVGALNGVAFADDATQPIPDADSVAAASNETVVSDVQAAGAITEMRSFASVVPDAKSFGGPIPTYQSKENLYWEIGPGQLDVDYVVVLSIARGIGDTSLYGGQSWEFGDDMVWRFKKVGDRIQIVRRNFRYRADDGPDKESLRVAFTDSIIFSLPIIARGAQGGDVVDVTNLFMSDQVALVGSRALGYSFARDRSTWEKIKAMKDNLELEVAA